jgi:probable F420-dependent oxidoreductase
MLNFGICFKGDMAVGRTVALAQRAERAGFTYCWTFDSHVLWKEYNTMIGYLAGKTEIMKLGPCVTNPGVRDWTVAASHFAALNVISGGRAVVGVGRGDSSRRVLGRTPMTIDKMKEFSVFVKTMAEGGTVQYEGKDQWFPWANPDYKLPIWVAGYGPKVLFSAGTYADGIILQIADVELVKWFISQVHAGAKSVGRNPKDIKIMAAAPVWISKDKAECRRHVKWFPAMVGNHVADIVKNVVDKDPEQAKHIPKSLTDYIKGREGYDYRQHADKDSDHLKFITDDIVDGFTIVGTVEDHIAKLRALRAAGVDQFNMYCMFDDEERIVEQYCNEVVFEVNKW